MMKAASGEFVDWAWNLSFFLFDAIVGGTINLNGVGMKLPAPNAPITVP